MGSGAIEVIFYFAGPVSNRKRLFEDALSFTKHGKVLYILFDEIEELPQLSQDLNQFNKHYMKMISFLYVKSLDSLIQSIYTMTDWQNAPSAVILDNLNGICPKDKIQNACGVVALLIDTVRSCNASSTTGCKLHISVDESTGATYCNTLKELYSVRI